MSKSQKPFTVMSWQDWLQTESGKGLFPSLESLRWFVRKNEKRLVESGAMVMLRNKWHFVTPEIDHVLLSIIRESTSRIMEAKHDSSRQSA